MFMLHSTYLIQAKYHKYICYCSDSSSLRLLNSWSTMLTKFEFCRLPAISFISLEVILVVRGLPPITLSLFKRRLKSPSCKLLRILYSFSRYSSSSSILIALFVCWFSVVSSCSISVTVSSTLRGLSSTCLCSSGIVGPLSPLQISSKSRIVFQ
uniref:Ovule protein n=1 Tax=Rodentolepis nana TaxID=102285 RepID=A0A0R3TG95_RODNA